MAAHSGPLPKLSITSADSADSGYVGENLSKTNLVYKNENDAGARITEEAEHDVTAKAVVPSSLYLLSPYDYTAQMRHRKNSAESNFSDVSTPSSTGSTKPLLSGGKERGLTLKLDESLTQRQANVQPMSKSFKMTDEDEDILRDTIRCKMPTFVNNTDFKVLGPCLHSSGLLHLSDYEMLTNMPSEKEKANHLYMQTLPRKGKSTYRELYVCLENAMEHMGHRDLLDILNKALRDRCPPRCSIDSSNSPTESQHPLTKLADDYESILRDAVCREMSRFVDSMDFKTLYSHLYSRQLIHSSDYTTLIRKQSNKEKGNCLFIEILPTKGRHTYRQFYDCLKNETEHRGHRCLVKTLDKALKNRHRRPPHCSTNNDSLSESRSARIRTHSELCCSIQ